MKTTLVTINTPGVTTGPTFDIFSNVDLIIPLASGVAKSSLLSGYSVTNVPDAATSIRVKSIGACTTYVDLSITTPTTTTTTSTTSTTTTTTASSWPTVLTCGRYSVINDSPYLYYGYSLQTSPINQEFGGITWEPPQDLSVKTDPAFNNFEVVSFRWQGRTWAGPADSYIDTSITLTVRGAIVEPTGWSNITINHEGTITTLPRISAYTTVSVYSEYDGYGILNNFVTWKWTNIGNTRLFQYGWIINADVN